MICTRMCRSYSSQAILFVYLMLLAKVIWTAVFGCIYVWRDYVTALDKEDGSDKEQTSRIVVLREHPLKYWLYANIACKTSSTFVLYQ